MLKYRVAILSGFLFLLSSFRLNQVNTSFLSLVQQADLKFMPPANCIETNVISNYELNYQYAIIDTVTNIEIRYIIHPLQALQKRYNGPHSDTGMDAIDPNFLHTNLLVAYTFKIQGKEVNLNAGMPDIHELPHATIEYEYNGDWGAKVSVQPCDDFGQKYKYCTIFAMHKENTADVYIFYLYNNQAVFEASVNPDFHSLVFNKSK